MNKRKNKSLIKASQIVEEPSLKYKRKVKPFDVVIENAGSKKIVKVNMVGATRGERNALRRPPDDQSPGPSGQNNNHLNIRNSSTEPILHQLDDDSDPDFFGFDPSEELTDSYNMLQTTKNLTETFVKGFMSINDFIECQQNDLAINNYKGKTHIIQGIICVVRKSRFPNRNKVRAIIPISVLRSFATTLHYSYKYYHQSSREILNIVKRDFFVLKESVVYEEVSKCIACLSTEQDMSISQSYALNQVPKTIPTDLHFDIVCGLPITASGNKYVYAVIDAHSGFFITFSAKSRKPEEIEEFFMKTVFFYTLPLTVTTDQEVGLSASRSFKIFVIFMTYN